MSQVDFNDPEVIEALTVALEAAGVDGIEITAPDQTLHIVLGQRTGVSVAEQTRPVAAPGVIKAPMPGIFLKEAPARMTAHARMPVTAGAGGALGFLQVGPILTPLFGPGGRRAGKYLVEQGDIVGFGDALIEIESP